MSTETTYVIKQFLLLWLVTALSQLGLVVGLLDDAVRLEAIDLVGAEAVLRQHLARVLAHVRVRPRDDLGAVAVRGQPRCRDLQAEVADAV